MTAPQPQIRIERVYDSYAIGTYEGLVVWVVDGHTPVAELEALRHALLALRDATPHEKSVALTVIHSRRTTMNAEERKSVLRMIDETKHDRAASATVILAQGMIGALHRSILAGFTLLVPPPHPARVCGTVEEAVAFLEPYIAETGEALEAAAAVAMVEQLQDAIVAHRGEDSDAPEGDLGR